MRAAQDGDVIEVDRETMLTLTGRIPEMSDIVIGVFAARRTAMSSYPAWAGATLPRVLLFPGHAIMSPSTPVLAGPSNDTPGSRGW